MQLLLLTSPVVSRAMTVQAERDVLATDGARSRNELPSIVLL